MEAVARLEVRRAACLVAATAPGLAVAATVASRAARPVAAQVEVGMAAMGRAAVHEAVCRGRPVHEAVWRERGDRDNEGRDAHCEF